MFHYVVAHWNVESPRQTAIAAEIDRRMRDDPMPWVTAVSAKGFRAYCTGARASSLGAHTLPGDSGVIFGTVFARASEEPRSITTFDAATTDRLLATEGRDLVDHYWGRYVAFLLSATTNSAFVLRSPTGELDCLHTSLSGVELYFSDAERCPPLDLQSTTINWSYVAASVAMWVPQGRQTGVREIDRIVHGECIARSNDRTDRRQYWHPARFIDKAYDEDPQLAAKELTRTARTCVHAWSSCYQSIMPMLSGGFDSSAIVGLLRDQVARPNVVCLNYRNAYDRVTDERRYARLAADFSHCLLLEYEQRAEASLRSMLQLPKRASPYFAVFDIDQARIQSEFARAHHAEAYFSGEGGDQLFFQNGANYACADYVWNHGLRPKLLSVALNAARMEGGALIPTLRQGIRAGRDKSASHTMAARYAFSPLLRREVTVTVRRERLFTPHWLEDAAAIPPGKCLQLIGLSLCGDLYNPCGTDGDPENVYPFFSQPLQELCLRIPTYMLIHGARDRGLARLAFKNDMPAAIVRRTTKGFVSEYTKEIFKTNVDFIRELVLDGVLVNQGLIDLPALQASLSSPFAKGLDNTVHIMNLAATEAWARSWTGARLKIAA